jgi:hypothetical protein
VRPPSIELRLSFETAVSQYQRDLAADTTAQAYLASRGIDQAAALAFRLGVVTSPQVGHEGFAGRLVIPYLTPAGVVNMRFRCLKQHDCGAETCPKYLGVDGLDTNLFNVMDLKKSGDTICVAEGEIDALTLSMAGLPAVGVPGVENWKKHFSKCLEDFSKILIFADGDKAGRKFSSFLAREVRAVPIRLPPGEDVNSLYVKGGADALQRLLAS